MMSLQSLLCKKDKVLSLLQEAATEAHQSVQALVKTCNEPDALAPAEELLYCRVVERRIADEIQKELNTAFLAPVHTDELEVVSEALYKIPKIANKFRERFLACPDFVRTVNFNDQLSLLEQASELVLQLAKSLQDPLDQEQAKAVYERLQSVEQEADKRMLALYRDLYGRKYPDHQVFVLKDLFELLEKLIDRTKRAGRLIFDLIRSNC